MSKPKVTINCVANHYASPDERIIEFLGKGSDGKRLGGLIRFFVSPYSGRLYVDVYRQDRDVVVHVSRKEPGFATRKRVPR